VTTPVLRCGFSANFARYSDVVSSMHVVFVRNQNWISDFKGLQIHILAVFRLWSTHFYSAHNARIASAVLATAIPSVCLSVRLSHAGIVSKQRHVARCSFHRWIAKCV